jgi:hypothetical protein
VIDVQIGRLPRIDEVSRWNGDEFAAAIRHEPTDPRFNPSMRQLLHVSFKMAAKRGQAYLDLLEANQDAVARNVTFNLYQRHMTPLFVGDD